MKVNKWTVGLAAAGLISVPISSRAEERMNQVWTALSSTTISGYVDTSAHWDLGSGNAFAPGYSFNAGKQDGFNLNVVKLTIEKPLDESQWAAGYKADLLFGPDANAFATQSAPLSVGGADFGVKQAYVAMRAPVGNGLDFKLGVWDTIIGYEVFEGPNNPNYTRSWGYTMEPTTHTGLLMSYRINDTLSANAGIANTFGPTINGRAFYGHGGENESYKTYMGSLAFTAPENWGAMAGSTLYGGIINGQGGLSAYNQTHFYVGATVATPVEGLRVGASYDYVAVHDAPTGSYAADATEDGKAWANAVALYTSFQASEKMSVHVRGEYVSHSDKLLNGFDPDGGGPLTGADVGGQAFPGKVLSLTGTVQYDLWKNVLSRLEVRWDHSATGDEAFGGDPRGGGPSKINSYLVAANVVYKF
jgi:hypothetical protein